MLPSQLTFQESLFIKRRRAGLTQKQMAAYLGVTYARYRCWVRNEIKDNEILPAINLGPKLKPMEICVIKRRRKGLKQKEVAKELGVKTPLVSMMEKEKIDGQRLLWFWGLNRNGEEKRRKAG